MIQPLPGFRDFYPEPLPHPEAWSCDLRQHVLSAWRTTARKYGFREYDGPPLEPLELYTLKSGEEIVQQLFNFLDKGGREVALRPEMTPTVARMIATAERHYRKPVKWFAIPQLFRYEKQQRGRLREHFQFNADIFGEATAGADAELVALLIDSLRALGLSADDFVIRVSSRHAWQSFFESRCADPSRAYEFYQAVDKLEREKPEVTEAKLSQLGASLKEVTEFISSSIPTAEIQSLLDDLRARGMQDFVKVDYGVIRGLAYYTGIVFEAFDRKGRFRAIAGGGRYDQLVHLVSGGKVNLPALGFGMGDVVLTELLKDRGLSRADLSRPKGIYLLIEDESLRSDSLQCVQSLRDAGVLVDYPLAPTKSDKQFKRALELAVGATVRLERAEDGNLHGRIRNLSTRSEVVRPLADLAAHCRNLAGPSGT